MRRAANLFGWAILAGAVWTSSLRADILAEYTYSAAMLNPNTQGWTWSGFGTLNDGGDNLLVIEPGGADNAVFTDTVPANVFFEPWSMTGRFSFPGNGQEEFGKTMFADDGTNLWHLSFLNAATVADGIYQGGDPNDPNALANTATLLWAEQPNTPGPFDALHDWSLVDTDGAGGLAPDVRLDGVSLGVSAIAAPSMFPAGTVGFGTLSIHDTGFMRIAHVAFDGNPNAIPEPGAIVLAGIALLGVAPMVRRFRRG